MLRCKFNIDLFVTVPTEVPEYRKVIVTVRMNALSRLHPKSDLVLQTLGRRLHHAITNPQLVDPDIPKKEYRQILKEIRPSVWKAYVNKSST